MKPKITLALIFVWRDNQLPGASALCCSLVAGAGTEPAALLTRVASEPMGYKLQDLLAADWQLVKILHYIYAGILLDIGS